MYLTLFAGEIVPLQLGTFFETLLIFILLPFVLAMLTRWALATARTREWASRIIDKTLSPLQLTVLVVVLFVMFVGQASIVLNNIGTLSLIFVPILIFFILSFIIAQFLSRVFRLAYEECALLTCTTAARNSPLVLAIAIGLFPDQPLIHVAIIIGVLIEPLLLIFVVRLLKIIRVKVYLNETSE